MSQIPGTLGLSDETLGHGWRARRSSFRWTGDGPETAGAATIRFWDVNEHQPVATWHYQAGRVLKFEEEQSGIFSLAFRSSGCLLACGFGDGQLQLLSFPGLKAMPGGRRRAGAERLAALCFLEDWGMAMAAGGISGNPGIC
eukprot:s83_g23.t1